MQMKPLSAYLTEINPELPTRATSGYTKTAIIQGCFHLKQSIFIQQKQQFFYPFFRGSISAGVRGSVLKWRKESVYVDFPRYNAGTNTRFGFCWYLLPESKYRSCLFFNFYRHNMEVILQEPPS